MQVWRPGLGIGEALRKFNGWILAVSLQEFGIALRVGY
jgi:hypothetical protein